MAVTNCGGEMSRIEQILAFHQKSLKKDEEETRKAYLVLSPAEVEQLVGKAIAAIPDNFDLDPDLGISKMPGM